MLTLDLALITYRQEGMTRLANMYLPHIDGVRYIVSWQEHHNLAVPQQLHRDDIEIHRFDKPGLSNNRNNAIDHCRADIIMLSDDDLTYAPGALQYIIRTFEDNPGLAVATFRIEIAGAPDFPAESCRLGDPLPRNYNALSPTIAFRREAVGNLRMHPEFGLNSPCLHGAEDELFLLSAIRRGLDCRFFPYTICSHPHPSTGTKELMTSGNLKASGCYITIAYPLTFMPRLILKAWRLSRDGKCSLPGGLYNLLNGAAHAPHILRGDRRYLW